MVETQPVHKYKYKYRGARGLWGSHNNMHAPPWTQLVKQAKAECCAALEPCRRRGRAQACWAGRSRCRRKRTEEASPSTDLRRRPPVSRPAPQWPPSSSVCPASPRPLSLLPPDTARCGDPAPVSSRTRCRLRAVASAGLRGGRRDSAAPRPNSHRCHHGNARACHGWSIDALCACTCMHAPVTLRCTALKHP